MKSIVITIAVAIVSGAVTGFAAGGVKESIIYSGIIVVVICLIYIIYGYYNRVAISIVDNHLKHVLEGVGIKFRKEIAADNKILLSTQTEELIKGIDKTQKQAQKYVFASVVTILRNPDIETSSIPNIKKMYNESLGIFDTVDKATRK